MKPNRSSKTAGVAGLGILLASATACSSASDSGTFAAEGASSASQAVGAERGIAMAPTDEAPFPSGGPVDFRGGEKAHVSDYPFIIAGLREGGTRPQGQTCTGSIVGPRKILTAAHCKDAAGDKSYLYGLDDLNQSGGFRTKVVDYKKHPKYVNFDQGYDVAMVTVADDIPVPPGFVYPKVATSAAEHQDLNKPGKQGFGLGYGMKDENDKTRDVTLEKAYLPIVEPDNCNGVGAGFKVATMICTGYSDGHISILKGDSGGPFIVDNVIVGVASWSRSDFFWYSVYGRLNNDMGDWVKAQINNEPDPLTASFTVTCSNFGAPCAFDGKSSTGGATSYAWDYGDGQKGSGVTSTHKYTVTRVTTFNPKLTVSDGAGHSDTATRQVTCYPGGGSPLCFAQ
ncbi:trypsin-like serine protease [Pendulispora albinea]|uniref:Trypsin-like serine protease n=2 Tax=cellular organisms TaxID=131567 RepID=A0ABZ2M028_9BACT